MRRHPERAALAVLVLVAASAHGEYCIDWRSWLQHASGQSGHCWASESECNSYYFSRCMSATYRNDCAGMCYYKPGQYPRTGEGKGKPGAAAVPSDESAALQKKLEAQKKADAAARDQQFQKDRQGLLGGIKGVAPATPANRIDIKLPPPSGAARQQLDCAGNEARSGSSEKGPDWDRPGAGCKPLLPAVPPVPAPVEVPDDGRVAVPEDPALRAQFYAWLADQMGRAHQRLSAADNEVAAREQDVAREEQKQAVAVKKPGVEDDALKNAREALAKARADRERTARELRRLEQQEAAARSSTSPATGSDKAP